MSTEFTLILDIIQDVQFNKILNSQHYPKIISVLQEYFKKDPSLLSTHQKIIPMIPNASNLFLEISMSSPDHFSLLSFENKILILQSIGLKTTKKNYDFLKDNMQSILSLYDLTFLDLTTNYDKCIQTSKSCFLQIIFETVTNLEKNIPMKNDLAPMAHNIVGNMESVLKKHKEFTALLPLKKWKLIYGDQFDLLLKKCDYKHFISKSLHSIPLSQTQAQIIAQQILKHPQPFIVDLSLHNSPLITAECLKLNIPVDSASTRFNSSIVNVLINSNSSEFDQDFASIKSIISQAKHISPLSTEQWMNIFRMNSKDHYNHLSTTFFPKLVNSLNELGFGIPSIEIVKACIQHNHLDWALDISKKHHISLDHIDTSGNSLWHFILSEKNQNFTEGNNTQIQRSNSSTKKFYEKLYEDAGHRINQKNHDGLTPLFCATKQSFSSTNGCSFTLDQKIKFLTSIDQNITAPENYHAGPISQLQYSKNITSQSRFSKHQNILEKHWLQQTISTTTNKKNISL